MRKLLSVVRRATDDYNMIEKGDNIAVGLSGGKDSLTLLSALAEMRRFYPNPYELVAITLDMGFEGADFTPLADFCKSIDVPFHLVKTDIAPIVFDYRKEKNPCSLCAKLRRGVLHDAALGQGCNKVALGHHFDDAIETYFLSLFYEGRMYTFSPVTYLDRKDITLIRPLIYMPEREIISFATRNKLPVCKNPCKANGNTKRQEVKDLIKELSKTNFGLKEKVFGAICRAGIGGFHEPPTTRRTPLVRREKEN